MHFGLFSINAYAAIEPRTAARLAKAAEAAGFESLWGGEILVGDRTPVLEGRAERAELRLEIANADPHDQPPSG